MERSIGGDFIAGMIVTMNEYLLGTYVDLADNLYPLATLAVALYIVYMGYRFLNGRIGESLPEFLAALIIIPLVVTFFFNVGLFMDWIHAPVINTMLGLMELMLPADSALAGEINFLRIFQPIDKVFAELFAAVDQVTSQASKWSLGLRAKVFIVATLLALIYGILYIIFAVLLILSIFSIYVLLVIGPIYGLLAGFRQTRSYFFVWLKGIITYALIPVFTAAIMGITLKFLVDATSDIQAIDLVNEGLFTQPVGSAMFIGVLSIVLHFKSPEFASLVTGGQVSGVGGGFFGTMAGVGAAGAAATFRLTGTRKLTASAGKGISDLSKRAYSKLRGFE